MLFESKLWNVEGHLAESTWRGEAFGCKMQRQYADVLQTVWFAVESWHVLSAYLRKSSDTGFP
jgi:hypothetical protein